MPRATTAAWLVLPPIAVRMPFATSMPWISSGVVSLRTRITGPLRGHLDGIVRGERHAADGRAGRGGDAGGQLHQLLQRLGVEDRVQQLIELRRARRAARLSFFVDQAFFDHLDRDANRRRTGALAVAGLQHVQRAFLAR